MWIAPDTPFDVSLKVPGRVEIPAFNLAIVAELREAGAATWADGGRCASSEVAFTSECPHLGFRVRSWRKGDRMQPFGMDGHVKVGDLFTNAKVPRALRGTWPMVVRDDEILWVVGLRRAASLPLGETVRQAVVVRVDGALPWQPC